MSTEKLLEKKESNTNSNTMPGDEMNPGVKLPSKTGRVLVVFREDATEEGAKVLADAGGLKLSMANEAEESNENKVYSSLGVAVINPNPDQRASISSASSESNSPILIMEEEQIIEVNPISGLEIQEADDATWGLIETKVFDSAYSGAGIKIAILDTGIDLQHPDFKDRKITYQSFVKGEEVQDGHGHGTHVAGTACGPRNPNNSRRYGVAYEAELFVGKVLNNQGTALEGSILEGINWAIKQRCTIISMSIGGRVTVGESHLKYSQVFETAAYRALEQGILIIAAAGNDSHREQKPSIINPVSRPAYCPSIMAVGAIDNSFNIARFSNGWINAEEGGKVDIVGPGVNVYSSWPMSRKYITMNGTSMATPHVSGIAALYAQANPNIRGRELWNLVINNARRLNLPEKDVGVGLVQAP